jgi:transcriptional regulator with XRE-family HTH domain
MSSQAAEPARYKQGHHRIRGTGTAVLLGTARTYGRISAETMFPGTDPKAGRQAPLTSVGRKLREIRIQKALTQRDVATRSGLPSSQISRIENGYRLPSLETLERITVALQVPISDVFYEVGTPHRPASAILQDAVSRIIAKAREKGTGDETFLLGLGTVLPRLTRFDCELILSMARKMAATKRHRT